MVWTIYSCRACLSSFFLHNLNTEKTQICYQTFRMTQSCRPLIYSWTYLCHCRDKFRSFVPLTTNKVLLLSDYACASSKPFITNQAQSLSPLFTSDIRETFH